jgi:FMN phosphatase YigB (HAD superfamily)
VVTGRLQLQADRERLQKNILKAELVDAGLSQQDLDSKGLAWEEAISARYQKLTPGATGRTAREQYQQLAEVIPLPDEALQTLARDRAAAVKTYLVTDLGLDASRAVIEQTRLDDKANLYSGVELAVET